MQLASGWKPMVRHPGASHSCHFCQSIVNLNLTLVTVVQTCTDDSSWNTELLRYLYRFTLLFWRLQMTYMYIFQMNEQANAF